MALAATPSPVHARARHALHTRHTEAVARTVVSLPDRLAALLLWATVVATAFAVVGQFRPILVLPALIIVAVMTWQLIPMAVPPTRSAVLGVLSAVGMIAIWIAVNLPQASRYVIVDRDPGFLTLEAMWLSHHSSPNPSAGDLASVAAQGQVIVSSGAFTITDTGDFNIQGTKALPAVLALGGWAVGDVAAIAGNLLLGSIALLAVYALARRMIGPWWALVPIAGLTTSMPMAVFCRAAYTEPLTMSMVFLALTFGFSAFSTRRLSHFAMSGLAVGVGAMIRIDGSLQVIGLLVAIALAAAFTSMPRARGRTQRGFVVALTCALVPIILSYIDLLLNSRQYLHAQRWNYGVLLAGLAAAAIGAAVLVAFARPKLRAAYRRHSKTIGAISASLVVVMSVVLISRPLWYVGHQLDGVFSAYLALLQEQQGLPVDGSRSYDESTVNWLAWYLGWPTVILGFLGLAGIAARTMRQREPRLLLFLGTVVAPSALYLLSINITPDQIWAVRRLLPVTIPGLLIAAAWLLKSLWAARRPRGVRWLCLPLAAMTAILPALSWNGLFAVREHDGRYGELMAVCDALTTDRVIYVSANGPSAYLESLSLACDVQAVSVSTIETQDRVRQIVDAWGGGQVNVITFSPQTAPFTEPPIPLRRTRTTQWDRMIEQVPSSYSVQESTVYVGITQPDGTVLPLS